MATTPTFWEALIVPVGLAGYAAFMAIIEERRERQRDAPEQ
jgi:hypothetical protein